MKYLLSVLALGLLASSAQAANGFFVGTLHVKAASSGCSGFPSPGFIAQLSYKPPGLDGSGTDSVLSIREWWFGGTTSNYVLNTGTLVSSLPFTVDLAVVGPRGTAIDTARAQFTSQVPSTLLDTTKLVTINGKILGYQADSDCNVTFDSVLYNN